jgi:UDPglucose 6-dehydrogenase
MNICVVGTGYVGLVTGACFAEFGNPVTCVDKDVAKIEALELERIPIFEPGLDDLVERNVKAGRLKFSTDLAEIVRESLVVFIAVGTPQGNDGRADLSFVRDVAKTIAQNLNSYKVVVTKSTVPAGTGKMIRQIIEENMGEKHPFSVASNPEFLREGSAIEDFMRPNRVVLGTEDEQSTAILEDLYRPLYLIETPIVTTDVRDGRSVREGGR